MPVTAEASTAGARTVLLASPRSFCAGVERAIAIVEQLLAARGGPIYVRKQIVHNTYVVADPARVSYLTQTTLAVDETTEIIAALRRLGPLTVVERETTRETVHFTLPPAVRPSRASQERR